MRKLLSSAPFLFLILFLPLSPQVAAATFEEALMALNAKSYGAKQKAVLEFSKQKDPRAVSVLAAMVEGDLFSKRGQDTLYVFTKTESGYDIKDVLTGEVTRADKRSGYNKVKVNNRVRKEIRQAMARMQLTADDRDTRLSSVKSLLKAPDSSMKPLLESLLVEEKDDKVRESLQTVINYLDAADQNSPRQLDAIKGLSGQLEPSIKTLMDKIAAEDSGYSPQAQKAAARVLADIEELLTLNKLAENIFFGLSLGAVLLLAAIGLAITFGVMGVINMAHGEMIMLGAYTTFVVQQLMPNNIELSLLVALPAAFLVSGLVGVGIERGVIRHLYGRPLETLLATFGISLILQQAVRSIFGPLNQSVITPDWMSGSLEINSVLSLTYNRLYIIIFSLLVLAVLVVMLRRTAFGLEMRAVTQNRGMASSMGIRTGWVDALTFGLGSGIAGIAGVALSQLTNVGPNLGQSYIIDSFMVVVFGGVGNLFGTFVGAMSLGIANKLAEPFTGAVLAKILVLVFIILFIQKRPRGLFALKGRAAEG